MQPPTTEWGVLEHFAESKLLPRLTNTPMNRFALCLLVTLPVASSSAQTLPGACLKIDSTFNTVDGGCKDLQAGSIWSGKGSCCIAYDAAVSYCGSLAEGGFTDWRMPSVEELQALIAKNPWSTSLSSFEYVDLWGPSFGIWSNKKKGQWAWVVNSTSGDAGKTWIEGSQLAVICVRGVSSGGGGNGGGKGGGKPKLGGSQGGSQGNESKRRAENTSDTGLEVSRPVLPSSRIQVWMQTVGAGRRAEVVAPALRGMPYVMIAHGVDRGIDLPRRAGATLLAAPRLLDGRGRATVRIPGQCLGVKFSELGMSSVSMVVLDPQFRGIMAVIPIVSRKNRPAR
jgi:Protein of unknown function (DUF1566)